MPRQPPPADLPAIVFHAERWASSRTSAIFRSCSARSPRAQPTPFSPRDRVLVFFEQRFHLRFLGIGELQPLDDGRLAKGLVTQLFEANLLEFFARRSSESSLRPCPDSARKGASLACCSAAGRLLRAARQAPRPPLPFIDQLQIYCGLGLASDKPSFSRHRRIIDQRQFAPQTRHPRPSAIAAVTCNAKCRDHHGQCTRRQCSNRESDTTRSRIERFTWGFPSKSD